LGDEVTISRSKRRIAAIGLTAGSVFAGMGLTTLLGSPAQAIPSYERSCAFDAQGNTAVNGWLPVNNSAVRVNNGDVARNVVVNFNADAGVDANAEIRLGYSVDGGAVRTPGAQNFANHDDFWETRHSMVVFRLPAGVHRIQPYWRISGAAGKNGVIAARCLTAEAYTK
jgi:hypothetical protein